MRVSYESQRTYAIQRLEREHKELQAEERQAPHTEQALTVWTMADTLSGQKRWRDTRLAEVERDLFLARCGYRLLSLPPSKEDPTGRILTLLTLDLPFRVAGRVTRDFLHHVLPEVGPWPMILYQLSEGHVHVACTHCGEPFLQRRNTDYALALLEHGTHPTIILRDEIFERDAAFDAKIEAAIIMEYRTVPDGPQSPPISQCPVCGVPLEKETVQVIKL